MIADDKHFHLETNGVGDSIQINKRADGCFSIEIEEPFAGSTETGFGSLCSVILNIGQMTELHRWIGERLK